jgi:starch-binding outer membrane protein, SusD/RagB family
MKQRLYILKRMLLSLQLCIVAFVISITTYSCNKLVESAVPSESLADANVYTTDATSVAVLNGIYAVANNNPFQGNQGISVLTGLSADELTPFNGIATINTLFYYYTNSLTQKIGFPQVGAENWSTFYKMIFRCNAAIEGLSLSKSLTSVVKQQLLGEARFFRAFCFFYLVNLFGDVPLPLTTDPEINTRLGRTSKTQVYDQIIADLQFAEENLSADFLKETLVASTLERVRPSKWAAVALLARVYLYTNQWEMSEAKASEVINHKTLFELLSLNDVFKKNSREAIWQLQPTGANFNTVEAQVLVIPQNGLNITTNFVFLSDTLINSFEPEDLRAKHGNWIDTTIYKLTSTLNDTVSYVNKYKLNLQDTTIKGPKATDNMKEYFMMLRLGEQYLIRAEARAQLGRITEARDDLNAIRKRAFSPEKPISANDKASLLIAILHERQVELFMELGHRWLDLKRTEKIDEIMKGITPLKSNGSPWQSYQQWYPLPRTSDVEIASNLVQNEGYQ